MDDMRTLDHNETTARAALEKEHDSGRLADKLYAGFKDY
jgi:hypothetical protein